MTRPIFPETRLVSVDELRPAEYNPRAIDDASFRALKHSLEKWGLVQDIVWNSRNGNIVGGHQRIKALHALMTAEGIETVPCKVMELTDEEERELNVTLNSPLVAGQFTEAIYPHLDELKAVMPADDFEKLRFDDLLGYLEDIGVPTPVTHDPDSDPDAVPPLPADAETKPGDIWLLGEHRVICGDSTDKALLAELFGSTKKATMCFTDPPYNVDFGSTNDGRLTRGNSRQKLRSMTSDNLVPDEWREFVKAFGRQIKERTSGDCYVWGTPGPQGMRMRLWLIEFGMHWSATIIWKKDRLVLSPAKYQRIYESCLYGWFGPKSSFRADRKQTEHWEVPRPHASADHPVMKPVELGERAIRNSSHRGDVVLDLFLGSGSTLISADRTERRCFGAELEPAYCDVTVKRWEDLTGKKAERAG